MIVLFKKQLGLWVLLFNMIYFMDMHSLSDKYMEESYPFVLVTSTVKCGTHLLTKAVEFISGKKQVAFKNYEQLLARNIIPVIDGKQFIYNHIPYSAKNAALFESKKFRLLYIYRDPRDQLISRAYWVLKQPEIFPQYKEYKTVNALITRFIQENSTHIDYHPYLGWVKMPYVCSIKFEELVGPKGGGSLEKQVVSLRKIAKHLRVVLTKELEEKCVASLFGEKGMGTFRSGQIGQWKEYFTAEQITLFKERAGDLLIRLGYEKNNKW